MTQSQTLDLLDMMKEMLDLLRKIDARLEQPAPDAAVANWQQWENFRNLVSVIPATTAGTR